MFWLYSERILPTVECNLALTLRESVYLKTVLDPINLGSTRSVGSRDLERTILIGDKEQTSRFDGYPSCTEIDGRCSGPALHEAVHVSIENGKENTRAYFGMP